MVAEGFKQLQFYRCGMCYDALIEGDEGKSYGTLLREELPDAVTDGLVVAVVVLVVLAANAVASTLALGAAVAGFMLGVVVHQFVLVVGVSLRRTTADSRRWSVSH